MLEPVVQALATRPDLLKSISLSALLAFIDLVRHLRSRICQAQSPHVFGPPLNIPSEVVQFLSSSLGLEQQIIRICWDVLSKSVWNIDGDSPSDSGSLQHATAETGWSEERRVEGEKEILKGRYLQTFLDHGLQLGIGFFDIEPPTRVCLDTQCVGRESRNATKAPELTQRRRHEVTLFTRDHGALPVWSNSLYCRHCRTCYHPNYYIHHEATERIYYRHFPLVLQGSMRFYVETTLCERYANMMMCIWASATNCARVYNLEHPNAASRVPVVWPVTLNMDCDNVWDSFFLYGLLLDHRDRDTTLILKHNATSQAERLSPALRARNAAMVGPGQKHWNHACNLCCEVTEHENGKASALRAVVTDGITLGHPCCRIHDCKTPLPNQRAIFCLDHEGENNKCCVISCNDIVEPGHQTCARIDHRSLEAGNAEQNRAMFQLKQRLQRYKISQTEDALQMQTTDGSVVGDELAEHDADGLCDGKPETGNRKVRALFGRRRTHNEELCVATCGVILGRATFFGSEGPNGVRVFHRTLFPTPASLPGVIFHDNNCQVKKVIRALNDTHFDRCALPVDVFHMKTKHKDSDDFCNSNCNPMLFPYLVDSQGKWRFNSSAAEITNAWFGGFQSIVREMREDRFNFFLDEMIRRRNDFIVSELLRKGHCPYGIPRTELLTSNV